MTRNEESTVGSGERPMNAGRVALASALTATLPSASLCPLVRGLKRLSLALTGGR
ncbi:hypothetical protein BDW71DRAFT_176305 [Aspergillus fruticulosus]